jgi:hypothetical protein
MSIRLNSVSPSSISWLVLFSLLLFLSSVTQVSAQERMKRKRAEVEKKIVTPFQSPQHIHLSTPRSLRKGNIQMMIKHSFGPLDAGLYNFYGLDVTANIHLSLAYGITDKLSLGIARTKLDKVVQGTYKYNFKRQKGSFPLYISLAGDVGFTTLKDIPQYENLGDRMTQSHQLILGRHFGDGLTAQINPIYSYIATTFSNDVNQHNMGLGAAVHIPVTKRGSLTLEAIPVVNLNSDRLHSTFSVGWDIKTGGHVFQLFLTNSNHLNPQYMMSQTYSNFWDGDIRFGFNVNRVFGTHSD